MSNIVRAFAAAAIVLIFVMPPANAQSVPANAGQFAAAVKRDGFERAWSAVPLARRNDPAYFPESDLDELGYDLLVSLKRPDDAVRVFELAARLFAQSWNAFDSLGEGYRAAHRDTDAVAAYRRSFELFPNNWNAWRSLNALGAPLGDAAIAGALRSLMPDDVVYDENVVYGRVGSRELRLHVVRPKSDSGTPKPAIVYVHGGGWFEGRKEDGLVGLVHFARRGYIGVAVEYRLSGEQPFPAQVEDVKTAIRFLRANGARFDVDPNRLALWGNSAGGNVAALAALSGDTDFVPAGASWQGVSSRVKALCDWNGPTKLATPEALANADPLGTAENRLFHGPIKDHMAEAERANPVAYVTRDSPPAWIVHGLADTVVTPSNSDALAAALRSQGIDTTYVMLPRAGHFAPYSLRPGQVANGIAAAGAEYIAQSMDYFLDSRVRR
ncbi:MAG: lipase/esterase [Candidatus Eremiobacteraeota bacterium]|nr:lipase/esterase [Candidatus Eremiobacteraeota bacterium]